MAGDHDIGYKQLFAHPEMVRDLLRGFTPFSCFDDADAADFERVNASFVSDASAIGTAERHDDMVWKWTDGERAVYIVLEFQARPQRYMALRMQVYAGLLYQDQLKRHQLSLAGLPTLLPIVFYHGAPHWGAARELGELIVPTSVDLQPFLPAQRYFLINQRSAYCRQVNGNNLLGLLFRVEKTRSLRTAQRCLTRLAALLGDPTVEPLRNTIVKWAEQHVRIMFKGGTTMGRAKTFADVAKIAEEGYNKWKAAWIAEFGDQYIEKGRAKGEKQGLEKGLKKGMEQGMEQGMALGRRDGLASALHTLLRLRFGALPKSVVQRLEEASVDELNDWLASSAVAHDLPSVFERPPGA